MTDWKCRRHSCRSHDIFINYRVRTEKQLAERLFLTLSAEQNSKGEALSVFFDKACLVIGEYWEIGFLNGLSSASVIVLLISEAALEKIRRADQEQDNVLLEYEHALTKYEEKTAAIVPVLIGREVSEGAWANFRFGTQVYPDLPHIKSGQNIRATMNKLFDLQGIQLRSPDDDLSIVVKEIKDKLQNFFEKKGIREPIPDSKIEIRAPIPESKNEEIQAPIPESKNENPITELKYSQDGSDNKNISPLKWIEREAIITQTFEWCLFPSLIIQVILAYNQEEKETQEQKEDSNSSCSGQTQNESIRFTDDDLVKFDEDDEKGKLELKEDDPEDRMQLTYSNSDFASFERFSALAVSIHCTLDSGHGIPSSLLNLTEIPTVIQAVEHHAAIVAPSSHQHVLYEKDIGIKAMNGAKGSVKFSVLEQTATEKRTHRWGWWSSSTEISKKETAQGRFTLDEKSSSTTTNRDYDGQVCEVKKESLTRIEGTAEATLSETHVLITGNKEIENRQNFKLGEKDLKLNGEIQYNIETETLTSKGKGYLHASSKQLAHDQIQTDYDIAITKVTKQGQSLTSSPTDKFPTKKEQYTVVSGIRQDIKLTSEQTTGQIGFLSVDTKSEKLEIRTNYQQRDMNEKIFEKENSQIKTVADTQGGTFFQTTKVTKTESDGKVTTQNLIEMSPGSQRALGSIAASFSQLLLATIFEGRGFYTIKKEEAGELLLNAIESFGLGQAQYYDYGVNKSCKMVVVISTAGSIIRILYKNNFVAEAEKDRKTFCEGLAILGCDVFSASAQVWSLLWNDSVTGVAASLACDLIKNVIEWRKGNCTGWQVVQRCGSSVASLSSGMLGSAGYVLLASKIGLAAKFGLAAAAVSTTVLGTGAFVLGAYAGKCAYDSATSRYTYNSFCKEFKFTPDATDSDVHRAWRKASFRAHPDKPGGSTEAFLAISKKFDEIAQLRDYLGKSDNSRESKKLEAEGRLKKILTYSEWFRWILRVHTAQLQVKKAVPRIKYEEASAEALDGVAKNYPKLQDSVNILKQAQSYCKVPSWDLYTAWQYVCSLSMQ